MHKLTCIALIMFSLGPYSILQEAHVTANLVERTIRAKEPSFQFVRRDGGGFTSVPSDDDHVSLYFKIKGQEVFVGTTNQKTVDAAKFQYGASTSTSIMRPTYKPTPDGEKLKSLVSKAEFYKNDTGARIEAGHRSTFDVAFRKGTIVIVVEARKAEEAQRIALYIAENLPD